jgi:3-oxoacid CoA-transferase
MLRGSQKQAAKTANKSQHTAKTSSRSLSTKLTKTKPQQSTQKAQKVKKKSQITTKNSILTTQKRFAANKVFLSAKDAVLASGLRDGDTVLAGGFGLSGIPMTTIRAIHELGIKDMTVVSNNCGTGTWGLGILLNDKRIKKMISSYVGENPEFERQYLEGELELELTPQGTLAEKLRAGGAGIPAFFTPTAVGTLIQQGGFPIKYKQGSSHEIEIGSKPKEVREFNNKKYVMEESITGQVAIIKAWRADEFGNIQFRGTARNFNPECAMAGRYTIAEVDEIVPTGSLNPQEIHLSGGYIQAVIKTHDEKRIERRTVIKQGGGSGDVIDTSAGATIRERIARRAALELRPGMNVNLGIGMPTLIPKLLPPNMDVMFQSENGILGMGPYPLDGEEDADYINAGKETVTLLPGAALFSSSESFAMIRGGHIALSILGGMEVSRSGDLANWIVPKKMIKGMGGAMDLTSAGFRVVVTMEHNNKKGDAKILDQCTLPITGPSCVDMIITDLAVFEVNKATKSLLLTEKIDDITVDELRVRTGTQFDVSPNLRTYQQI